MSDDEYYDEFDEDIFWIEEPEPDAAVSPSISTRSNKQEPAGLTYYEQDDLAATAHYDALYIDDPVLEAEDYFSDWEELSDDFYDDDPTAIRRLRAMGQWPNKTKEQQKQERAQPLSKKPQPVQQNLGLQPDLRSFQSVMWKSPADENKVVLYQPGTGEQVALLKNWREVFRNSHPALERSRAGRPRGAVTNGVAPAVQPAKQRGRRTRGSPVPAVESVPDDADDEKTVEKVPSPAVVRTTRVVRPPSTIPVDSKTLQENSIEVNGSLDAMQTQPDQTNGTSAAGEGYEEVTKPPTTPRSTRGRKRKASVSQMHPVSNENNDDGRRSKRVASKKVGDTTEQPPPTETTPVRRSARRKK